MLTAAVAGEMRTQYHSSSFKSAAVEENTVEENTVEENGGVKGLACRPPHAARCHSLSLRCRAGTRKNCKKRKQKPSPRRRATRCTLADRRITSPQLSRGTCSLYGGSSGRLLGPLTAQMSPDFRSDGCRLLDRNPLGNGRRFTILSSIGPSR